MVAVVDVAVAVHMVLYQMTSQSIMSLLHLVIFLLLFMSFVAVQCTWPYGSVRKEFIINHEIVSSLFMSFMSSVAVHMALWLCKKRVHHQS